MNNFTTNFTGALSEQLFICSCLEQKINCLVPIGNYLPYDVLTDYNGHLTRCQVKTIQIKNNSQLIHASCRCGNTTRQYTKNDCDVVVGINTILKQVYILPIDIIYSKHINISNVQKYLFDFNILKNDFTNESNIKLTNNKPKQLLSLGKVSIMLGVHISTARRLVDNGELDAVVMRRGHRRVPYASVRAFLGEE